MKEKAALVATDSIRFANVKYGRKIPQQKQRKNSVFDISCCEKDENSCAWESIVSAKVGDW